MGREKLIKEQGELLNNLIEQIRFIYSEEFCKLNSSEQQKYLSNRTMTEAHLCTVTNLLYGDFVNPNTSLLNLTLSMLALTPDKPSALDKLDEMTKRDMVLAEGV